MSRWPGCTFKTQGLVIQDYLEALKLEWADFKSLCEEPLERKSGIINQKDNYYNYFDKCIFENVMLEIFKPFPWEWRRTGRRSVTNGIGYFLGKETSFLLQFWAGRHTADRQLSIRAGNGPSSVKEWWGYSYNGRGIVAIMAILHRKRDRKFY